MPLSLGRATESAFLPNRISVGVLTSQGLVKFPSQPSNLHVELITWAALHLSPNCPFVFFFFWRSNWLRGIFFPGLLRKDTSRLSPPVPGLPLFYQSPLTDRAGAQPPPIPLIPASLVHKSAALPSLPHTARHPRIENSNPQLWPIDIAATIMPVGRRVQIPLGHLSPPVWYINRRMQTNRTRSLLAAATL